MHPYLMAKAADAHRDELFRQADSARLATSARKRRRQARPGATPPNHLDIRDLGTVLGVWAHPDDEAYLSAALMAEARDAGHPVVVATATVGQAGGDGDVRSRELRRSLAAVGVREHHYLGFEDGHCAAVPAEVGMAAVLPLLRQVRPDTILTFGPDGMTGHPDHVAVSGWVHRAWQANGYRGRLFHATLTESFHRQWGPLSAETGIWMPGAVPPSVPDDTVTLHVSVTGVTAERKLAALRAHASQTEALRGRVGDTTFREWWGAESFVQVAPAEVLAA